MRLGRKQEGLGLTTQVASDFSYRSLLLIEERHPGAQRDVRSAGNSMSAMKVPIKGRTPRSDLAADSSKQSTCPHIVHRCLWRPARCARFCHFPAMFCTIWTGPNPKWCNDIPTMPGVGTICTAVRKELCEPRHVQVTKSKPNGRVAVFLDL